MCPPMPSSTRLARTTIAIAFQRTRLLMRRSISRLPGYGHFLAGVDRVDVGRIRGERQLDAVLLRVDAQLAKQPTHARRATVLQHVVERLEPFAGLERLQFAGVTWCGSSSWSYWTFRRGLRTTLLL